MVTGSIDHAEQIFSNAPAEIRNQYPVDVLQTDAKNILAVSEDPMKVVKAINRALLDKKPSFHYFVGYQSSFLRYFMMLPNDILDLFGNAKGPTADTLSQFRNLKK